MGNFLGIKSLINAAGTLTEFGGCRMYPEAAKAMADVSGYFIDFEHLHRESGKYIAKLLGVEAALITAGAAAALVQAMAACMAGCDPNKRLKLPHPPEKNETIIMRSHRNPYDQALVTAGAKLIEIGSAIETQPWELESVISEKTAAVAFFLQSEMLDASLRLKDTLKIAHKYGVPVIVDAAAELPPKHNLWKIAREGADLVVFSGGKDIRGPQTSGLMVGRSDLIEAAAFHSAPNEGIARPMKAGKEIVSGFLKALETYLDEDEGLRFENWESLCSELDAELSKFDELQVARFFPTQPRVQPAVIPRIKVQISPGTQITVDEIITKLRNGDPPIVVDRMRDAIIFNCHFLEKEDLSTIVSRMKIILQH